MKSWRIRAALWWTAVALLVAACDGGGEGGGQVQPNPGESGESTAYEFKLSGYAPTGGSTQQSVLSSALAQPAESGLVTVQGQLLPLPDGAADGRVYSFAVRINEREASVVEAIDLPPNLPQGVYDFYAILHNQSTSHTYGGVVRSQIIAGVSGQSRNVVFVTLYPVLEPISTVREFRALADAAPVILTYDPAQVGATRPKLEVTLSDSTQLIYVINPAVDGPTDDVPAHSIRLFISGASGALSHRFYYGDVDIQAPSDGTATSDPTPVLQYTIDDPCFAAGTCNEQVLIDGEATSTRNGDPLPSVDDGSHTVRVIFTDADGNSQQFELSFLVDATPPTVVVQNPGSGSGGSIQDGGTLESDSGQVNVSTDEPGSLSIYLDPDAACVSALGSAGDTSGCAGFLVGSLPVAGNVTVTSSVSGLAPGEHKLYLVAVDGLGNQSIEVVTFTVVDATAPQVQITAPANIVHDSRTVPFAFMVSDDVTPLASLTVAVAVERFDTASAAWVAVSGWTVGTSTLSVGSDGRFRVIVSASNPTPLSSSVSREFRVDTTWPVLQIVEPAHNSTVYTSKPALVVQSTEDNLYQTRIFLVEGRLDAGATYDETSLLDIPIDGQLQQPNGISLVDGEYTVVVEMTDVVNHWTVATSSFTVNAAAPFVEIINPEEGALITNGTVNLKYNVRDASHAEVWVRSTLDPNPSAPLLVRVIDPVQPVPRTYQDSIGVPIDGDYSITVVAKDVNLPAAQSEDQVSFTADGHMPAVEISAPTESTAYARPGDPVAVVFQASNATAYQVLVGPAVVEEGALDGTPTTVEVHLEPFSGDSTQTVQVRVSDGRNQVSDSITLVIDGTAPVVTIQAPTQDQQISGTSVTLLYAVTEANGVASEQVWLDGYPQEGATSGTTFINLSPGTHVLEGLVSDTTGNPSNRTAVTFDLLASEPDPDEPPRRGRTSCIRTPIAGDEDALDDLLRCVRSPRSPRY